MKEIWLAEDDPVFRETMTTTLREAHYSLKTFANGRDLLAQFPMTTAPPDLLLLDVRMPRCSGLDVIKKLREAGPLPPTLLVSGEASISETVSALNLGVYDFLEKPFSPAKLLRRIANCLAHVELKNKVAQLQDASRPMLLGDSPSMLALKQLLAKVAPTDSRVLIHGESGTGKELVADYLHQRSARAKAPFIKINCAAFPANLIESELFGYERGAFTGAQASKAGLIEAAHHGTLMLDEIGDMEPALQTRLLRVLEDGEVRRIGGRNAYKVDVRVIAATHQDLRAQIKAGQFREDLFFRLNTIPVAIPPLRERGSDIDTLATYFIHHFCKHHRLRIKTIDSRARQVLRGYPWPGNVRELRNVCERLSILGGDPLRIEDLPSELFDPTPKPGCESGLIAHDRMARNMSLKAFKTQCEREFIETTLRRFDWDYVAAAQCLDIQRTYLHRKISQLGIPKPGERDLAGDDEWV